MQLEPRGIWSLLGIEAGSVYPTAVDCPICHGYNKLEVRTTDHIHCTQCHFNGDIIELLSVVREEKIADTVADLESRALVDTSEGARDAYLVERRRAMAIKDMLYEKAWYMAQSVPPSIMGILNTLNCRFNQATVRSLLPHICDLRKDDIEEVGYPKEAKETMRWWGKYTALAIPCWCKADVVGFELITPKGWRYLPLCDNAPFAAAFGQVASFMDDVTFVVDSPVSALRMTIWTALQQGKPVAFVNPYGLTDFCETYSGRRTVFWSPQGDSRWYLRAIGTPGSQTFNHRELAPEFDAALHFPFRGSFGRFKKVAINSLPAHQAAAQELLTLSEDAVRGVLTGLNLNPSDRAKIAANAQGEDSRRLLDLFDTTIRETAITWNGVVVSDSPEGWKAKGKVISAAKFQIDQIRPTGSKGEAIVTGSIIYQRQSIRFREKLSVIRRNPGEWLIKKVITNFGTVAWVDSAWKSKLLEVAQQFHTPKAVLADDQYGWDEKKLRMPNFMVDAKGLYVTRSMVDGPGLLMPSPLNTAEWEAFKSPAFCRLALTLVGTLLRTSQERAGMGILLTNEFHVISRAAHALGATVRTNPSMEDVEDNALSPLPLFVEWTGSHLREIFEKDGYKNLCLSVDAHTAKLSTLNPDWVHLKVGSHIDYGALRSVFLLLPKLLRCSELDVDSDTFYRSIADTVRQEVEEHCVRHALNQAASDLDTFHIYRGSTAASRIMQLIFYGMSRNEIDPELRDDSVVVRHDQFLSATASAIVPMPSLEEITSRLAEARFLVETARDRWHLSRITWDMNASLAAC